MITIYDLKELFIDDTEQLCYIWKLESEKEIFRGYMNFIPDNLLDEEIMSLDNVYKNNQGYIGINIDG